MSSVRKRIEFLDLCRIIAVISVFAGHKFYGELTRISECPSNHIIFRDIVDFLKPICYEGGFGVVLFFCVSGYIIRYVLEIEDWREFLIKRVFRIFPLYWAAVLIWYFLTPHVSRPPVNNLIIQLSLFGDFFNVPYALNWVEWTLRIEILFYILLGTAKAAGLFNQKSIWLIVILFGISLILFILPAWPANKSWSQGYVSIYSPFLFVGVYFREFEKGSISKSLLIVLGLLTILMYCYTIQTIQPNWINQRFSVLGVLVFSLFYWKRLKITLPAWAMLLSELTYGLYLFHNWIYDYFCKILSKSQFPRFFSLIALILFCYALNRLIEKPGIIIGRTIIRRLNKITLNVK
jgi:peptidoglycan/LPS O-acetylase OafA/YrhL